MRARGEGDEGDEGDERQRERTTGGTRDEANEVKAGRGTRGDEKHSKIDARPTNFDIRTLEMRRLAQDRLLVLQPLNGITPPLIDDTLVLPSELLLAHVVAREVELGDQRGSRHG
jgi:hypothetical protein